ncbi:MAG: YHYH protein [Cytophagales bacterium]|nr:YHYH protein [Cytophagales bacterium]
MKIHHPLWLSLALLLACGEDDKNALTEEQKNGKGDNQEQDTTSSIDISVLTAKFYHSNALSVKIEDEFVVITSKNLPDHKSMYYPKGNSLYENYSEPSNPDFKKNPNSILEQEFAYRIPRFPKEKASNKESTPFGPMGVAINSVAFFNQNAAPGDDILEELNTFDQYEGHPANAGDYHYHLEHVWLTASKGEDAFVGLLLDGFPVYGPKENGKTITNSDLDDYHGHTGPTADFPNGIYHYHITDELPWINGDGFLEWWEPLRADEVLRLLYVADPMRLQA